MKVPPLSRLALCLSLLPLSPALHAAPAVAVDAVGSWHAQNLMQAIAYMLLFAAIGIMAAVLGYKAFDRFTPGNLHKEIFENRNVAAAIVGAAVILGICLIIAAAMVG